MSTQRPFVVRGNSGHLIVPIIIIPTAAAVAFSHFRENLPAFCLENAEKVLGIAAALTLALIVAALFLKSRSVEMRGGQMRYRSWFTDRTVPASYISAVSFEAEASESSEHATVEHFLTLWRGDEVALKFNLRLWPRSGLRDLLRWLTQNKPSVRLDLAVERYAANRASD